MAKTRPPRFHLTHLIAEMRKRPSLPCGCHPPLDPSRLCEQHVQALTPAQLAAYRRERARGRG